MQTTPDSKVHGANVGPTWVLAAQGGPQMGPMNLVIRDNRANEGTNRMYIFGVNFANSLSAPVMSSINQRN